MTFFYPITHASWDHCSMLCALRPVAGRRRADGIFLEAYTRAPERRRRRRRRGVCAQSYRSRGKIHLVTHYPSLILPDWILVIAIRHMTRHFEKMSLQFCKFFISFFLVTPVILPRRGRHHHRRRRRRRRAKGPSYLTFSQNCRMCS